MIDFLPEEIKDRDIEQGIKNNGQQRISVLMFVEEPTHFSQIPIVTEHVKQIEYRNE